MKSARFVPSAFLRRYNQIYPEMPLRLFGVPVLMLACAGNSGCNNK